MREEELKAEGVYIRKVKIVQEDVDENGYASVLSLASNMQDAAGDQLIDLGIGFDVTSKLDLLWVVVWSEFTFLRFPKLGDTVTFYTWPGAKKHWFYPRRAYVFDENGEELMHAAYMWMLMDAKTRKVTEDKGVLGVMPRVKFDEECKLPQMKADFPQDLHSFGNRTVSDAEVDNNKHLNNAHYLNWTADVARSCGFGMQDLRSLWINYKKEILPGETVELLCERNDNRLYVAGGGTGEHHFIAILDFA